WKMYLILIILLLALSATVVISNHNLVQKSSISEKYITKTNEYVYQLSGAVKYAKVSSMQPLTYRELFLKAKINETSDISSFSLSSFAKLNDVIFIPFKDEKINFNDITSPSELVRYGIKIKIAEAIIKLKNDKDTNLTWEDIGNVQGVGPVTLKRLQKYLILEN
ncbi:hypothetical protein C4M83_01570, partial [Mycoplasmopsis pullorum]